MPESTYPPISVIVCTRNRPSDVECCLPTVLSCDYPNFEVVVVDQSTQDDTKKVVNNLQREFRHLRYVPTPTVGKTIALNIALSDVKSEILAFTDDDCQVPNQWLGSIAAEFSADPEADIVFGPVLPSPDLKDIPNICVPSWVFREDRRLRRREISGMGANMAMRRSVLCRLPKGDAFDCALGPGAAFPAGEEGDFVYRLRRAGAVAALKSSLLVYHRAYRTPEHWQKVLYGYGIGDAAFYVKHARCGDLEAAWSLLGKVISLSAREVARAAFKRAPQRAYVRGLFAGMAMSLRYPVDRRNRTYIVANSDLRK